MVEPAQQHLRANRHVWHRSLNCHQTSLRPGGQDEDPSPDHGLRLVRVIRTRIRQPPR